MPRELPEVPGYHFSAQFEPARHIGGDFYDVFPLGNNKFGILIGDVADKGVPSAIFMARAHALIIAEADNATTPAQVLKKINAVEKQTQYE